MTDGLVRPSFFLFEMVRKGRYSAMINEVGDNFKRPPCAAKRQKMTAHVKGRSFWRVAKRRDGLAPITPFVV